MSDRKNDNRKNFRNNQSNHRNRSRPGYKKFPAPDRSSRRHRSGGLVRAKILDYKPGKEFGKLVPLEGEYKLTQIVFYKSAFDDRVEHYVYKNQEVMVLLKKENDAIEVAKLEVSIDYRPIPGEEKTRERTDETKKDSNRGSKEQFVEKSSDRKEKSQKSHPKPFQKDSDSTVSKPSTIDKSRSESPKSSSKREKKKRSQKPKELENPLAEIESLTSANEVEQRNVQKPKKERKPKGSTKRQKEDQILQESSVEEISVKEEPISTAEQTIVEDETVPKLDEAQEVKKQDQNVEENFDEPVSTSPSTPEIDMDDLNSLVNQMASTESSQSPELSTTDEDDSNSLLQSSEVSEEKKETTESKEHETNDFSFDESADLDDLVSALSSSDDLEDVTKQYQEMLSQSTEDDSEPEMSESGVDSKYQIGFSSENGIYSMSRPQKKVEQEQEQEVEDEEEEETPRKSLKEELAEETEEESLLEQLVGKIAVEIDEEEDDDEEYDEDESEEEAESLKKGTFHLKEKNVLSEVNHEPISQADDEETVMQKDLDESEEGDSEE